MQVIATAIGFDGKQIRNPGDKFDMPDGSKGSWFAPLLQGDTDKPAEKPAKGKKGGEDLT